MGFYFDFLGWKYSILFEFGIRVYYDKAFCSLVSINEGYGKENTRPNLAKLLIHAQWDNNIQL